VYHLAGFELRTRDGHPETGSVGVLERTAAGWAFDFVPDDDLTPFTPHNWKWVWTGSRRPDASPHAVAVRFRRRA
jgi:hypothetical protein